MIYLDFSTAACLGAITRRRIHYRGALRPDLGVYDRISGQFLRWVWSFRRRQRPALLAKLAAFDGQAFVLRRRREVRRFLDKVAPSNPEQTPETGCFAAPRGRHGSASAPGPRRPRAEASYVSE